MEVKEVKKRIIQERLTASSLGYKRILKYSTELKRDVVNLTKEMRKIGKKEKTLAELGLTFGMVNQWDKELNGEIEVSSISYGKTGTRYTIPTKIAAVEQVLEQGMTITSVARTVGCNVMSLSKWIQDYKDGLYVLENVTQITRKPIKTVTVLISEIKVMEKELLAKKAEAKQLIAKEYEAKLAELEG